MLSISKPFLSHCEYLTEREMFLLLFIFFFLYHYVSSFIHLVLGTLPVSKMRETTTQKKRERGRKRIMLSGDKQENHNDLNVGSSVLFLICWNK